jgi:RecB family exonuclease
VEPNLPDPDRAAMLAGGGERLLVPTRVATGRPPLGRPDVAVHPDVPLSFSAIGEYVECPARFRARRILRLKDPGFTTGGFDPQSELITERDHGREFGNAVHDVFEWLAGSGWKRPSPDLVRAALEQYGLDPDEKDREERAGGMIRDFLDSELGDRARAGKCRAEVPILVRSGAVMVRGFIDLVVEGGERPLIVDYKTNSLAGSSAAQKMAGYELQRDLYAHALGSAGDHDSVDTAWVFLEDAPNPVEKTLTRNDLAVVKTELAGIVNEITSGMPMGSGSGREPCGQCWACERLGAEQEQEPDPAPATLF